MQSQKYAGTSTGSRPIIGHNPGNVQHSISMATIPFFPGIGIMGPDGQILPGQVPGQRDAAGRAAPNGPAPPAAGVTLHGLNVCI